MDVPISQAYALEVRTADPWHFTEEIALGDSDNEYRYLMRWKVDGHHIATLSAVAIESTEKAHDVPADATSDFNVTVKWDGCCDWRFAPADSDAEGGYLHTCDPAKVSALAGALVYAQRRGLDVLQARERLAIFG